MGDRITNCDQFQARLQAYLDNELEFAEKLEMEAHASACPECGVTLDQMTRMLTMCAELDEGLTVPRECHDAWKSAIRDEAKKRRRPAIGRATRVVSLLAAALVVTFVGVSIMNGSLTLPFVGAPKSENDFTLESNDYGEYADDLGYDAASPALGGKRAAVQSDGAIDGDAVVSSGEALTKPVVLKTATRELTTTGYDASMGQIGDVVSEYDGYFELRSETGSPIKAGESEGRVAKMSVRVPSEQLDAFLESLDACGTVIYRQEKAEDVSSRYSDTQARLVSLRAQLARLDEMNATAQSVEDLIAIEEKAAETRYEIESLEGAIRDWDSRASYAAVSLTVTETAQTQCAGAADDTLRERIETGFHESVNWLVTFLEDAAVFLATIAPRLAVWLPAAVLVVVLLRLAFRRRKKK